MAYSALFSTYYFVQHSFARTPVDRIVRRRFASRTAPFLQKNPAEYDNWLREISDSSKYHGVDIPEGVECSDVTFHLLYFSNRLGFRETKHSISAAHQTLFLGWFPGWTICTLTHEFLHAHVRGILSSFYPGTKDHTISGHLYDMYRRSKKESIQPENLLKFLQLLLMDTAHNFYFHNGNGKKESHEYKPIPGPLPEQKILDALKISYHTIDEIMVHILDYHYFYSADPDIYVEAIWSSWLTLPVFIARIPEYLMRTIATVASGRPANRKDRFEYSLKKVEDCLKRLENSPCIDKAKLRQVLQKLNDPDVVTRMRSEFYNVWVTWIDVILRFLFSRESIKEALKREDSPLMTLQDDESYAYDVKEGTFIRSRVKNPFLFLIQNRKSAFSSTPIPNEIAVEFHTLWLFSALSASLYTEEAKGD